MPRERVSLWILEVTEVSDQDATDVHVNSTGSSRSGVARREVLGKAQPADVVEPERAETRDRDGRRGRDDPVAAPARAERTPVASAVSSMLVVGEDAAERRRG